MVRISLCLALLLAHGSLLAQDELKYRWKPNQQFGYRIEIEAETPTEKTTYQGTTRYWVKSSENDQFQITYRGGLSESSKSKDTAARGGFPRIGPPPRPTSPFSRPTFAGKTHTKNEILIDQSGKVLHMEGDSQLPYLLGNVSTLPFEPLPAGNLKQWSVDGGTAITKAESRSRFGGFGPLGDAGPRSTQSAKEIASYAVEGREGGVIAIKKTYELSAPKAGSQPAFEVKGNGTWTFHAEDRVPEGLKFEQQLVIDQEKTKVTIPIKIDIRRLSADDLTKLDAEAKRLQEDAQAKMEAEKQRREAPLTAEENRETLETLASDDAERIMPVLAKLVMKAPKASEPAIVAALERLLNHRNKRIREDAGKALAVWSPEYKVIASLNAEYRSPSPVKSTERTVKSPEELKIGQIVQARTSGPFWFAAEVLDLTESGKVMVRLRGGDRGDHFVECKNVQLAPEGVEQPISLNATK